MRRPKRLPMENLAPYLCDPVANASGSDLRIDWVQLFGNDHPIEIEVGSGKGAFLIAAAEANPGTNYLGIEIDRALQLYVATRLAKRGLRNARVAGTDARRLFHERIPAASVRAVHVYFPDPWWKKRHHKRRVFTPEFAAVVARILRPGGRLHIVTDVEAYFGVMTGIVGAMAEFRPLPPPTPSEPRHDLDYLTNFERKFRKEGRLIYRAAYERTEVLSPERIRELGPGGAS